MTDEQARSVLAHSLSAMALALNLMKKGLTTNIEPAAVAPEHRAEIKDILTDLDLVCTRMALMADTLEPRGDEEDG